MSEEMQETGGAAYELDGLFNWMRFIGGATRRHAQGDVVVHVHGELDDSFIVIDRRSAHAPGAIDRYVLLTRESANSLMALVRLLKEFQFDLDRLVARLAKLDYGIEGRARLEHVEVGHRVHGESRPAGHDEPAPQDAEFVEIGIDEDDPDATLPGLSAADLAQSLGARDGRPVRPEAPDVE